MNISNQARRRAAVPLSFCALSLSPGLVAHAQPHEAADEVIVTGVMRDRAPGELAQSVTVVSGDTLDRIRAANLGETLANQVGVSSSYFGAGASRPIIRGLAGARVRMLEDGIDSMDAGTVSDDHAVTVEPLAADQIEIFRGPTTLLYARAVGGVNTVTTRIPTARPRPASAVQRATRRHAAILARRRASERRRSVVGPWLEPRERPLRPPERGPSTEETPCLPRSTPRARRGFRRFLARRQRLPRGGPECLRYALRHSRRGRGGRAHRPHAAARRSAWRTDGPLGCDRRRECQPRRQRLRARRARGRRGRHDVHERRHRAAARAVASRDRPVERGIRCPVG